MADSYISIDFGQMHATAIGLPAIAALVVMVAIGAVVWSRRWR
jgi:hypothetical protein